MKGRDNFFFAGSGRSTASVTQVENRGELLVAPSAINEPETVIPSQIEGENDATNDTVVQPYTSSPQVEASAESLESTTRPAPDSQIIVIDANTLPSSNDSIYPKGDELDNVKTLAFKPYSVKRWDWLFIAIGAVLALYTYSQLKKTA